MEKDIDESNQNIRIVSFDEVTEKCLTCLKIDKTIFLVGAGISLSAPTGLPSGQALTDYYLDISIGKDNAEKLRNLWSEINSIIASDHRFGNQFDFPMLRLEFIIGNINKSIRSLSELH